MIGHVIVDGQQQEVECYQKHGIWLRKNTADARTLAEVSKSYGWLDVRGKVILDIGAHIGCFSHWALECGADSVIAVEPDYCNFELLRENAKRLYGVDAQEVKYYNCAIVGENDPTIVDLYYTKRGFSHGMISIEPSRGRTHQSVDTILLPKLLRCHKPDVIKVDCEGAEYRFLDGTQLPDHVTQIAAEIHFSKKAWRDKLGPNLVNTFQGWTTVVAPKITPNNWATIAGWRR